MAENEEVKDENKGLKEESVLLKEYKKLQENSVSKEQYDKDVKALEEKASLYLKAITEGEYINTPSDSDCDINKAITDISGFKGTNLEYWKKMTSVTDQVLKQMPESEITKVTGTNGLEEIVKVNETMKQMVQDSNEDPDYFRTLYNKRVVESSPRIASAIEKDGSLVNYLQKQK